MAESAATGKRLDQRCRQGREGWRLLQEKALQSREQQKKSEGVTGVGKQREQREWKENGGGEGEDERTHGRRGDGMKYKIENTKDKVAR